MTQANDNVSSMEIGSPKNGTDEDMDDDAFVDSNLAFSLGEPLRVGEAKWPDLQVNSFKKLTNDIRLNYLVRHRKPPTLLTLIGTTIQVVQQDNVTRHKCIPKNCSGHEKVL